MLAIYVFIAYRRIVTFEDHPHTANAKPYGFSDGMDRKSSYTAMLGSIRPSMEKRIPSASSYLSIRRASDQSDITALTDSERVPETYSHERDTQFDSYVAQRKPSLGSPDPEMALSPEFNWDRPMRTASKPRRLSVEDEGRVGQPDRLVAVGSIMSRPRGASMPRAPSWQSDNGLVSVPEEDDGDVRSRDQMDRQTLLGNGRRRSDEEIALQDVDIAEPRWQRR